MPMDTRGFDDLIGDINKMAHALNTADEGAPAARRILQAAAVPVEAVPVKAAAAETAGAVRDVAKNRSNDI